MTTPDNTVVVDTREARVHKTIVDQVKRRQKNVNDFIIDQIEFGDWMFFGREFPGLGHEPRIGIEVSTVNDLLNKITTNRLQVQVNGMLESFDVRMLLIIGKIESGQDGNVRRFGTTAKIRYDRVMSILDAAAFHGVPTFFASTTTACADRIANWINYWQKPFDQHKAFRPRQSAPSTYLPVGDALDRHVQALMM